MFGDENGEKRQAGEDGEKRQGRKEQGTRK